MSLNNTQRYAGIAFFAGFLLLLFLSCAWVVNHQSSAALTVPQDETVIVNVPAGSNLYQVLEQLHVSGYVSSTNLLRKLWLKSQPKFSSIKAGWYSISSDMTLLQLLNDIHDGKVITHQITLVEGQTLWQWLEQMSQLDNIVVDISFDPDTFTYLDKQGNTWQEGYVLPETYRYEHLSSASTILRQAYNAQATVLTDLLAEHTYPQNIHSLHEWVTLASIIEKETGAAHERSHIAGVFLNRLAKRMRLQTDPTVIYGIGPVFDGDITRQHLRTKTPFNTYTIKGLPPIPIAAPSIAALTAVLEPETTADLYFVAKGNGEHYFSETLQQHNQAVRQYQLNRSAK